MRPDRVDLRGGQEMLIDARGDLVNRTMLVLWNSSSSRAVKQSHLRSDHSETSSALRSWTAWYSARLQVALSRTEPSSRICRWDVNSVRPRLIGQHFLGRNEMFVQQRTPHLRHRVFAFHSDGSKSIPVGIDQSVSLQHVLDRLLFVDDLGKLILSSPPSAFLISLRQPSRSMPSKAFPVH